MQRLATSLEQLATVCSACKGMRRHALVRAVHGFRPSEVWLKCGAKSSVFQVFNPSSCSLDVLVVMILQWSAHHVINDSRVSRYFSRLFG